MMNEEKDRDDWRKLDLDWEQFPPIEGDPSGAVAAYTVIAAFAVIVLGLIWAVT